MNTLSPQKELVIFNPGTPEFTGKWFARIKNTENGRQWIKRFREKNREFKVTSYGRSPNRRSRCVDTKSRYYPNYHKPVIADTIVIYLDKNSLDI